MENEKGNGVLKSILVPIAREGWPFIAIFAIGTLILFAISGPLGWIGVILTLWCVYFFRDPDRVTPSRPGLVISPADGVVCYVGKAPAPADLELGEVPMLKIGIFMNVFDVHVNRAPVDGRVSRLAYRPGKFFNASLDKASEQNERHGMVIEMADGTKVGSVQIAGLVARRIVCKTAEGASLRAGERYGLIRFGSRVDVYLPASAASLAVLGQRMTAGETVIADLTSSEPDRLGEIR